MSLSDSGKSIERGRGDARDFSDFLELCNHTIKHRVYIQRKLAVRKRRLLAPPACQQSDILQAHMDMVVVSDDGRDMTKSPITIVVNKAELMVIITRSGP